MTAEPMASWTVASKGTWSVVHWAAPLGWTTVANSAVSWVGHSVLRWVHSTVVTTGRQWDRLLAETKVPLLVATSEPSTAVRLVGRWAPLTVETTAATMAPRSVARWERHWADQKADHSAGTTESQTADLTAEHLVETTGVHSVGKWVEQRAEWWEWRRVAPSVETTVEPRAVTTVGS